MKNDILTKNQIAVLERVGGNKLLTKNFYLTGGTALTAFYLRHRYSEDLDFFSEKEFDVSGINIFFNQLKADLGIKKIDFQQSYNRNLFFFHFTDEILKTEFTFFPFPRIETGLKEYGIEVDSALDIAANKLFTIYQRIQARDYIDLYFLCREKNFAISDLIKKAKIKFDWHIDPIQLGTQFVKVVDAKDYPRIIKKMSDKEWHNFFIKEARKLKQEIID
ncbi:MAG: hypothetical protein A3H02_02635 [Candidatus Niyogibacteria bacterium RIFCSPLOWO2_12_FULL_41_13]|uniref:Nucleotidyl transferase AbiEii/AbiGii toxin family protein n=1 Tax=Candidatus Niyogibacteria bacterium RIFCSPLOWO2_12_FULL_41_13 TaxID=1801726 RepID=A0A1G2F352_9BACT|nr:MAG: hypothetical protein A3H02_02635 [Candidatus Niyogibacteria bacterium RIFCSPLOWO2_12_FULL_41_13]